MIILDNRGTAMTGFQPHPGLPVDAMGNNAEAADIAAICRALGAQVKTSDPFDIKTTQDKLLDLLENGNGARVLILRQICALSPEKKGKGKFKVSVDPSLCRGTECGCDRLCTRIFKCPGLVWNKTELHAQVDEILCAGCGVCSDICPAGAIKRGEVKI